MKKGFGQTHPMFINGRAVEGAAAAFEERSPIDTRILIGRFTAATREQTQDAIAAARAAFPAWSRLDWEERVRIVRAIGRRIRERRSELSALVGYETGKSRLECVGEVEEAADFFDYYCDRMEETDAFQNRMGLPGSAEDSRSVLRPYGVFGIIAPFNFPVALAAGPTAAALLAGNTIVCKAAEDTALAGVRFYELLRRHAAARRLQPRERPRRAGGPGDRRQPGRGRPRVHRVDGGRDEAAARQRRAPVSRGR